MKFNAWMFWALAAFFFVEGILYIWWNAVDNHSVEWAGSIALLLCVVLWGLIAFYLTVHARAQTEPLQQDRRDGEIDDDDPEMGFFSPWSWWPFMIGASGFIFFLGLAIGIWIVPIGLALFLVSIVGWTYEYYRGYFAR
ncbi:cytochrome c oxidase subunit 4 [Microbacterium sp. STN6]|uniref:cytochrome c oxidase subunit 4 n=1 Tax=Microbacterium sp. STN6 TaxID=2995588 RepID=UPI00226092CE|nr:cytochrome c oxidase subunit 4 [Microbacterium sp. STN6]MCX7521460.1 cytochrome c oxidase subunit 4 [Microbacterium sp. STN6]